VHGGMGFIEETGAAQHYRDARILPIYEGTNGIQALDLLSRKLLRDEGAAMTQLILELRAGLPPADAPAGLAALRPSLAAAIETLDRATAWLLDEGAKSIAKGAAGATPYLALCGSTLGGWLLARAALAAQADGGAFAAAKLKTARFYADNLLGETAGLAGAVIRGAESTLAFDDGDF
jgi:3-(methylthio)propanoyl-CoA dehydrogenase